MPFTPSHAVVALPFVRSPLVPSAVAVGAMTPDLPLFTRGLGATYGFTHDASNVIWTTVIAFGLLMLWRVVLRPGLVELAPDALAARLPADWRHVGARAATDLLAPVDARGSQSAFFALRLAGSLMLGVLTHIAWDAFSHAGRWGVEMIPTLQQHWGPMLGYKWVQHGSSVLGLLLLGMFAVRWLRHRDLVRRPRTLPVWLRWCWYVTLPAAMVAAWLIGFALLGPVTESFTVQHLAYRTLPVAVGAWGALTVVLCLIVVARVARGGHATSGTTRP